MAYIPRTVARAVAKYHETMKTLPATERWLKDFQFRTDDYPKMGLLHDDLYHENPVVKEALRRLPRVEQEERVFRFNRAIHLSMIKSYLPKEEWTKQVDDIPYLRPYIDMVVTEEAEKKEWALK